MYYEVIYIVLRIYILIIVCFASVGVPTGSLVVVLCVTTHRVRGVGALYRLRTSSRLDLLIQ